MHYITGLKRGARRVFQCGEDKEQAEQNQTAHNKLNQGANVHY